jgi:hypothetical protein
LGPREVQSTPFVPPLTTSAPSQQASQLGRRIGKRSAPPLESESSKPKRGPKTPTVTTVAQDNDDPGFDIVAIDLEEDDKHVQDVVTGINGLNTTDWYDRIIFWQTTYPDWYKILLYLFLLLFPKILENGWVTVDGILIRPLLKSAIQEFLVTCTQGFILYPSGTYLFFCCTQTTVLLITSISIPHRQQIITSHQ